MKTTTKHKISVFIFALLGFVLIINASYFLGNYITQYQDNRPQTINGVVIPQTCKVPINDYGIVTTCTVSGPTSLSVYKTAGLIGFVIAGTAILIGVYLSGLKNKRKIQNIPKLQTTLRHKIIVIVVSLSGLGSLIISFYLLGRLIV